MRIGGADVTLPLPPKPDRQISRIRLSSSWLPMGWLRLQGRGAQRPPASRASFRFAHPLFTGGPLVSDTLHPSDSPSRRRAKPRGTASDLLRGVHSGGDHHVPWLHGRYPLPRYFL